MYSGAGGKRQNFDVTHGGGGGGGGKGEGGGFTVYCITGSIDITIFIVGYYFGVPYWVVQLVCVHNLVGYIALKASNPLFPAIHC